MPRHQFPKGNKFGVGHGSTVRNPLTRALISQLHEVNAKTSTDKVHELAAKLIKIALEGDLTAIREIFDRVEGKIPQSVRSMNEDEFTRHQENLARMPDEDIETLYRIMRGHPDARAGGEGADGTQH